MLDRSAIKQQAGLAFAGRRWLCIGVCFLAGIVIAGVSGLSVGLLSLLIIPLVRVGLCGFSLRIWRGEPADAETLFSGFQHFLRNVGAMLLAGVSVFLWSLLFVIPGIIRMYSLRLVPYILAEMPDIRAADALKLSQAMTSGRKWDLFCLDLSFIGWYLLDILTFGLLSVFYVRPFYEITLAGYYDRLSREYYSDPNPVHGSY